MKDLKKSFKCIHESLKIAKKKNFLTDFSHFDLFYIT
jgi:hypothetical protein